MRHFLIVMVAFSAAVVVLRRFAGLFVPAGTGRRANHAGNRPRSARDGVTELVRDKVCNTFLPKSKALELTAAGEVRYFCSRECRSAFLAGPARQADIAQAR